MKKLDINRVEQIVADYGRGFDIRRDSNGTGYDVWNYDYPELLKNDADFVKYSGKIARIFFSSDFSSIVVLEASLDNFHEAVRSDLEKIAAKLEKRLKLPVLYVIPSKTKID